MSDSSNTAVPAAIPDPVCFAIELDGEFNGESMRYRAVAGETYIRDEKAAPAASFFTVSYLKADVDDSAARPVAFIFNGGPTSPAHWLHMGAFGPRRIAVPSDAVNAGAAPFSIVDNADSPLSIADLVFIDPIGTGYSRPLGTKETKAYWGLKEDARSVADFIETWITQERRWNSPKYLIGESYGTVRASLVAEMLGTSGIALNGIALVSAVQDYQSSRPRAGDGGILSYASFLPSYAAIAWYHGKIQRDGRTLESFLEEVRVFARTEYATALIANSRLSKDEYEHIAARLAAYTGLRTSYVKDSRLRVPVNRFFKELLRDQGQVIGRLDGRYVGQEADDAGESAEADPASYGVAPAFCAAINAHLSELGVRMPRPYVMNKLIEEWNWQLDEKMPNGGGFINVIPHLGRVLRRNKDLRVMVALGYYDLATPFFGAENALSQLEGAQERIDYHYYEVGHMIFLHEPSRIQFLKHVRRFLQGHLRGAFQ